MSTAINVSDYRERARRRLPRMVFDYLEGGADDETCLTRNRTAIEALQLRPSLLRDVSAIDTSVELFGQRLALPLAVAPTGLNALFWPDGDVELARAAASAGVPFALSTASNARVERIPKVAHGINWFQLYVAGDRSLAERMIQRARGAGYAALVFTVDVPVSGYRERDLRNGFRLQFRYSPGMALDAARHPSWLFGLLRSGMPRFVNLSDSDAGPLSAQTQAALLSRATDRTLDWDSLRWLRHHWPGPLLLKGVLTADDARRALDRGVDGIIVSNHGGRQLDCAQATIEALPEIVSAVGGSVPVLVDSGFRRGSDVVKALALGARAVLLGRATLYGLAADGQRGAREVLRLLGEELVRTMTLLGARSIEDLTPDRVIRPPGRA
jgi:(S)-mandelate dehydrogenase